MLYNEVSEIDRKKYKWPNRKMSAMANPHEKVLKFPKIVGIQIKETMKHHFTNTYYSGRS